MCIHMNLQNDFEFFLFFFFCILCLWAQFCAVGGNEGYTKWEWLTRVWSQSLEKFMTKWATTDAVYSTKQEITYAPERTKTNKNLFFLPFLVFQRRSEKTHFARHSGILKYFSNKCQNIILTREKCSFVLKLN